MLVDTHCHLTFPELAGQVEQVMQRAAQAGVTRVITVTTTAAEAADGLSLLTRFDSLYLIAGIHPHEAGRCGPDDLQALSDLHQGRSDDRLVGVGETGLDFHHNFAPRDRQEELFRFQLELARKVRRTVVIHARQSEARVCEILAEYPELSGRFVFHCFSADIPTARRILDMGGFLSFTGIVTFRNARVTRAVARYVPAERLLLETDAPYLSPEPVRGQRPNEPALLLHTARFVASLRGMPTEELAAITTANAIGLFGLKEQHP
jgi:TatD DNase family protein